MLEFREIIHGSAAYRQTLELRERVLRVPIGLVLSGEDTADEHRQRHFVMLEGDELAACVVSKPLGETAAKLRQMAVSAQYQGRHVGKRLIQAVENVLGCSGATHIEMSARRSAMGFYERLGYRAVGDLYIEQDIPHIRMEKSLGTDCQAAGETAEFE